jgi:2-polyprenyl-3-methyl-5-hydroxy-6-metoxy-1,4-benzoquinol methylase
VNPQNRPSLLPATIHQAGAEDLPVQDGYFDLVTCGNVIDRVPDPSRFVAELARLIRPGGLLVLSSPLDFRPDITPQRHWLTDLQQLGTGPGWKTTTMTAEMVYPVLRHTRQLRLFHSQVIGLVRSSTALNTNRGIHTVDLRVPLSQP